MNVTIRQRPRYVDPLKCTSCGDCVAVCPVERTETNGFGLDPRKAIYKLYPQAVPDAYAIEKRGTSPCRQGCPAHVSVQGFLALTAVQRFTEAISLIKRDNPFPGVCGRVCHHPCESACVRKNVDESLAISSVERFLADFDIASDERYVPDIDAIKSKKIAIVGSGPSGLSCAYFLAIRGYQVTVFEKYQKPGGMLVAGIPAFRLPRSVVEAEIDVLQELGVKIITGIEVGKDVTIEELRRQGYEAFFIGVGSHKSKRLGIQGEDLSGVEHGVEFLRKVNFGEKVSIGRRVLVIGGGNVAIDAARTALRLGAMDVSILYRGSVEQMSANDEEINECLEEGIAIHPLIIPVRILGENGQVIGLERMKMRPEGGKGSGREKLQPVEDSRFVIEADSVVVAIGQEQDWSCLTTEIGCELSPEGTILVDPVTYQTSVEDIFAGGDAVSGPATVIEAIASGKEAAISIDLFLNGVSLKDRQGHEFFKTEKPKLPEYSLLPRKSMPRINPEKRIKTWKEVQLGLSEKMVLEEVKRCLNCGGCAECYSCEDICEADAINLNEVPRKIKVNVGSVILAPGLKPFNPKGIRTWGYGIIPNVITSMEMERYLSSTNPTHGGLTRLSDGKKVKRMAFLQCVGSRDINKVSNGYCSSVCCMYAIKQALTVKEYDGNLEVSVFFIDMRTYGKDFERYYERAKKAGIEFRRCRVHSLEPVPGSGNVYFRYIDNDGKQIEDQFDLVVLSVGLVTPQSAIDVASKADIDLNHNLFVETPSFNPVATTREGVYVCGTFTGPKDIPQAITEASAAVSEATKHLTAVGSAIVQRRKRFPERDISREEPRIGVFVCRCGSNIAGTIDVNRLVDYSRSLPSVVYAEQDVFLCSHDAQDAIRKKIREKRLNRIVVAACTPRTHEELFRETIRSAGLNGYLLEIANIRNHASWVHAKEPEKATEKAMDLLRMAVAKAALLVPVYPTRIKINRNALVIGGGLAGMVAALDIAEHGFPVHLIEKTTTLGGQARHLFLTWKGEAIAPVLDDIQARVRTHPLITLHLNSFVTKAEGYVGNFKSSVWEDGRIYEIEHGVTVIATGGKGYMPEEYGYGASDRVFTSIEFDKLHMLGDGRIERARTFVFIQCVGSREKGRMYCSKVCCTHSIQAAIELKEENPEREIFILYRDIRTYGEREELFRKAREMGVVFLNYELHGKPEVKPVLNYVEVTVYDHVIHEPIMIRADILILATAIIPNEANKELAQIYKLATDKDGFLLEAHQKLRPIESTTEGVFLAGLAHYPKPLDEAISQAKATASKSVAILRNREITIDSLKATLIESLCDGCGLCLNVCPYDAIGLLSQGNGEKGTVITINTAQCRGCGICQATCPKDAVYVEGFSMSQITAQIESALSV